ncbi:MAG TPA: CHAT domain-containing protein [Vicinamibacterales bacterium]|nr:CHAT domain-containing protein [Vicinamibacterales bacterium]
MARAYLDFDLLVARRGAGYEARVLASPAGEASASFVSPLSELELENFRLKVGRGRHGVRRGESSDVETARTVGARMFGAVFTGDIDTRLHESLKTARQAGAGLRLRLTAPSELAILPWEFLYSADLGRFLAVSTDTTLVRYLDLPEPLPPLPITPPLRVLAMVASPSDYPSIESGRECASLRCALADVERRGAVTLDVLEHGSLAALQQRLRRGRYHIVHFVGHGVYDEETQEGMVVVEGADGRSLPVSARKLGALLHDHPSLRLVVLNMCEGGRGSPVDPYGGGAQALVRAQIPAVLAMQYEISDDAATTFAKEFYDALADGLAVDAALGEARKAMFMNGHGLEWGTPVLYTQSPDGLLFALAPGDVAAQDARLLPAATPAPVPSEPPAIAPRLDTLPSLDLRGQLTPPSPSGIRPAAIVPVSRLRAALPSILLVALVFSVNLGETAIEGNWATSLSESAAAFASALHWLEGGFTFENPDVTYRVAIYGYSTVYFFLFPALAIVVAWVLARRRQPEPFRTFALALAIDYAISLPFFLFFPVPERWAYPDANAILLSDLWSSTLIDAIRPVSALDNCFPSFHTSMTVVIVLCCYLHQVRFRTTALCLGAAVLASTFALGIHWAGDIVAGTAAGVVSVALARRFVHVTAPAAKPVRVPQPVRVLRRR